VPFDLLQLGEMTLIIGRKSRRIVDLGPLLLLVAMVIYFSHEMVWGGGVPFYRDLGPYFYPMRFSLAESIKGGEFPLWDRHVAMGFPLLANFQSGAFYPPHLLFLFLPFFGAIRALFVFHYLVAATGAYCLCRRWSYSPPLALIGAILFTFGGYTVSLTNLLNHFQTAVWLPWLLLLGVRSLHSRSNKDFLLFTIVILIQFLAGSPEVYALTQGLFLLEVWRSKNVEANFTWRQAFFMILTTNALVLGLSMVQLLPTMELFSHSGRSETLPYQRATVWSLHPLGLINFLFLDKEINLSSLYGLRLLFSRDIPWIVSLYIGVIAFPAILLWLFNSSLRERVVLLGLIMMTLILAMGHYTPVFALLFQYLPLVKLFRYPEKFLFVSSALALYVVLRGLFYLFQSRDSFPRGFLFALLAPGLLWLTLYLFLRIERESLVQFINQVGISTSRVSYVLEGSAAILINLERQIALTVGTILILFLWKKGRLNAVLSQSLLVGLVFFDLASAHQPYQFQLDPTFVYERDKVIPAPDPKPSRLFYLSQLSRLHPDYYILKKRPFADKVPTVNENLIPNTGVLYGFDYLQELDALARRPYSLLFTVANSLPPEKLYRLLGAMNVKYLISTESLPSGGITLVRYFPEYPSRLYRIDRVAPRAYIVHDISIEEDPLKVLDRLSSSEFDPANEVILEQPLSMTSNGNFKAQVEITRYTNHRVTIRATLDNSGVLVLADSFYPGWKVFVDGEERQVLRANYFFRGVFLSPGVHQVVFRYEPVSFYYGALISLLTLVVFSMILIMVRKT
jgi:hypothetical protein